jgi:hypothetical protein
MVPSTSVSHSQTWTFFQGQWHEGNCRSWGYAPTGFCSARSSSTAHAKAREAVPVIEPGAFVGISFNCERFQTAGTVGSCPKYSSAIMSRASAVEAEAQNKLCPNSLERFFCGSSCSRVRLDQHTPARIGVPGQLGAVSATHFAARPRWAMTASSRRTTRGPASDVSGMSARHSRVKSLTTLRESVCTPAVRWTYGRSSR